MEKISFQTNSTTIQFWDKNAKWYKLWVEHNSYHNEIIRILTSFFKPGWKVLDIGAGNGILALPLCARGCRVMAVEPSEGMRNLLYEEVQRKKIDNIFVEKRKWEDIPLNEIFDQDLIIASNSLHITELGFLLSLEKIFRANPKNIFIATEKHFADLTSKENYHGYEMMFEKYYEVESSCAYHTIDDAFEHWTFKNGRIPSYDEKIEIMLQLTYEKGHLWKKCYTTVGLFCWTKNKAISDIKPREGGALCFSEY